MLADFDDPSDLRVIAKPLHVEDENWGKGFNQYKLTRVHGHAGFGRECHLHGLRLRNVTEGILYSMYLLGLSGISARITSSSNDDVQT